MAYSAAIRTRLGFIMLLILWIVYLDIAAGLRDGDSGGGDGTDGGVDGGGKSKNSSQPGVREYCSLETFKPVCGEHEVVLITSGRYGRMRFGRCMKEPHGSEGCSADVMPYLDRQCSGRRTCSVTLPDPALHTLHPCPRELVPYLEAGYRCVPVAGGNDQTCQLFGGVQLTAPSGFLASQIAAHGLVGVPVCPWIIQVAEGRRINLTLYNFDIGSSPGGRTTITNENLIDSKEDTDLSQDKCDAYISVEENMRVQEMFVCDKRQRRTPIYLSTGSTIIIYMKFRSSSHHHQFMVNYKAVGCPDITGLANAVVRRSADMLTVKCNYTGQTYFLSCNGNEWIGEIHNCTKPSPVPTPGMHLVGGVTTRFPYGLLIVIGIGVALGVAVGIIMLFGILFLLRKRKEKKLRSATTDPLLSEGIRTDSDDAQTILYDTRSGHYVHSMSLARSPRLKPDVYASAEAAELQQRLPLPVATPTVSLDAGVYGTMAGLRPNPRDLARRSASQGSLSSSVTHQNIQNEMQTSFITFKPGGDYDYEPGMRGSRPVQAAASVDLVKDAQPHPHSHVHALHSHPQYKELNPETLVLECTCTLRQGQSPGGSECRRGSSVPRESPSVNKSI